jgi:hypothetical protein
MLAIAERLAQAGDVKPQAAFFYGDIGPDSCQQVLFADGLVGLGYQCNQDVEGSRAQW